MSLFVILTHPAGRLLLGKVLIISFLIMFLCFILCLLVDLVALYLVATLTSLDNFTQHPGIIAFFITCAFAAPVDEEKGTLNQYINRLFPFHFYFSIFSTTQDLDARDKDCDGGGCRLCHLFHRCHRQTRGKSPSYLIFLMTAENCQTLKFFTDFKK